jgi:hypothetical protein
MTAALIDESDKAVEALLRKRIERPTPVTRPVVERPPAGKRCYLGIRRFLMEATVRSVLYSLGVIFVRRPALWALDNSYSLAATLCSGPVGPGEFAQREQICDECSAQKHRGGHTYCNACGCPPWVLSRLDYKNRKRGHNCPYGLQPGSVATKGRRGGR